MEENKLIENKAYRIFEEVFNKFKENYRENFFYTERDVVWTIQKGLKEKFEEGGEYEVFNDYPLLEGGRRAKSTDLVIRNKKTKEIEVAIEFKYEPNHNRKEIDIPKKKFNVVSWNGVTKDKEKINELKKGDKCKIAIAIFIDEGGHFSKKFPENNKYEFWENKLSILWNIQI